jgi:cell division protein ZapA
MLRSTASAPCSTPRTGDRAMASVNVTINGRQFRMACEDGQEGHLTKLAKELDDRIGELRGNFGEIGDNRLIVMAALTVADELSEASRKLRQLEEELAALQDARVAATDRTQATQAAIVAAFNSAAERLEAVSRKLNQTVGESKVAIG